jgi:hypothetical protein
MKALARAGVVGAVLCCAAAAGATVGGSAVQAVEWQYPRGGRDPLVPPAALYTGQDLPRIDVTVIGVDSHHRGRPLAVVRLDSRPPVRRVVRPGDRVGEYRIISIDARRVRVSVPGLGASTTMDLTVRDSTSFQR